tara:strand:- start:377 stop:1069 length:693 start_codon:yes stop_codon:yes gene_type:complete
MNTLATFVRIPKNASTSVYESLGTANTIRDEKLFKFSQREKARYKGCFCPSHCLLTEAIRELGEEILDVPSLAVVRNPYDRLVSMYSFARRNEWMFAAYLIGDYSFGSFCRVMLEAKDDADFLHAFTQKSYLMLDDEIGVDRVLRFENINEEFKTFLTDFNIPLTKVSHPSVIRATRLAQGTHIPDAVNPVLPHENQTPHAPYKDFYCEETKSMVHKMWEEDLDEFKYTF